jgi:hypothetical protein
MKTKHISLAVVIFSVVFTSTFSSCRKKEKEETDSDTSAAAEQSLASSIVNDMTSIADEAGRTNTVSSFRTASNTGILSNCATLTFDTLAAAKTVTVSFGTSNCLGNDGRYRRGALILNFTGRYRDSLTIITVTPQNYFVNDNQVTGSKTITNNGHNAAGHLVYSIQANLQILRANNSGTITWQSSRQREWTAGEATLSWQDDLYAITGSASGTTSGGGSFQSNITSPLIRNMAPGCRRYFTAGTIAHTPAGKATRYLDYGNGSCDDLATVTINGNTYPVTLP